MTDLPVMYVIRVDGDTSDADHLFVTRRVTATGAEYMLTGPLAKALMLSEAEQNRSKANLYEAAYNQELYAINDDAVEAAVLAYDEARCRVHGPHERPMSDRNRQTISPMIRAALEAAAPFIRAQALEEAAAFVETHSFSVTNREPFYLMAFSLRARDDMHHKTIAAAIRALKEPRATANGEGE